MRWLVTIAWLGGMVLVGAGLAENVPGAAGFDAVSTSTQDPDVPIAVEIGHPSEGVVLRAPSGENPDQPDEDREDPGD